MLEIKITGNVVSCRLVTAAGKTTLIHISLETNRTVRDKEFTDWSLVEIFGDRAQKLALYITKGTKLLILVRPEARAFKADNGTVKAGLVIHANDVEFLTGKVQTESVVEEHEQIEEDAEFSLEYAAS